MTVLGIDPGTLRMGNGIITDRPAMQAADYGVIALPPSMPLEQRLYQMHTHILNLIAIFRPEAIAVEDPFIGRGERSFPASSLAIGQAQAVVLIGAAGQGIPIHKYPPAQVKRAVADHGAAAKGPNARHRSIYPQPPPNPRNRRRRRPRRSPMPPIPKPRLRRPPNRNPPRTGKVAP